MLHARYIVRECLARNWELVLVTTEAARAHSAFKLLSSEFGERLQTAEMPDRDFKHKRFSIEMLGKNYRRYGAFRAGYRNLTARFSPDVVYAIALEQIDLAMAVLGSPFERTPVCGMLLGKQFHHPEMGVETKIGGVIDRFSPGLFRRLLEKPNLKRLLTIDESLFEFVRKRKPEGYEKVRYVPDIAGFAAAADRSAVRESLGLSPDAHGILLYGVLGYRKGLEEAISAVADPGCPANVCLIVAGKGSDYAEAQFARPEALRLRAEGRLISIPGFITDEQEAELFAAADSVWIGYVTFSGMSGVLVQAGSMGLPVLACNEGLIGWMTRRRKCGPTFDPRSTAQAVSAIREVSEGEGRAMGERGRAFAHEHTPEAFSRRVCDAIEEAAG